ncbi:predicted protein [Phaeodactylum tricornutum CCAP 1055/1]|uniref:PDZ domain-containing protein n=4 Tax=Phaeodactylum tricornutum TaxID=2850 RepID=B7G5M6_PHATC|nr:predicted protein [Phaeodactylum tricornutum CCAP 1055/1]EEC46341.1 predicted protein [Phaeodactylum tricornutum CCAP 1055/1]|eukprot:XP_002182440.1 predicted protein [Phaeodactylum tricornutum CCAP 1055/1]
MAPLATHQSELDFLQTQLSALASEGDRLTSSFTYGQEATTKLPDPPLASQFVRQQAHRVRASERHLLHLTEQILQYRRKVVDDDQDDTDRPQPMTLTELAHVVRSIHHLETQQIARLEELWAHLDKDAQQGSTPLPSPNNPIEDPSTSYPWSMKGPLDAVEETDNETDRTARSSRSSGFGSAQSRRYRTDSLRTPSTPSGHSVRLSTSTTKTLERRGLLRHSTGTQPERPSPASRPNPLFQQAFAALEHKLATELHQINGKVTPHVQSVETDTTTNTNKGFDYNYNKENNAVSDTDEEKSMLDGSLDETEPLPPHSDPTTQSISSASESSDIFDDDDDDHGTYDDSAMYCPTLVAPPHRSLTRAVGTTPQTAGDAHDVTHIEVDVTASPSNTNLTMDVTTLYDEDELLDHSATSDHLLDASFASTETPILDRYRLDPDDEFPNGFKVVPNRRGQHHRKRSVGSSETPILDRYRLDPDDESPNGFRVVPNRRGQHHCGKGHDASRKSLRNEGNHAAEESPTVSTRRGSSRRAYRKTPFPTQKRTPLEPLIDENEVLESDNDASFDKPQFPEGAGMTPRRPSMNLSSSMRRWSSSPATEYPASGYGSGRASLPTSLLYATAQLSTPRPPPLATRTQSTIPPLRPKASLSEHQSSRSAYLIPPIGDAEYNEAPRVVRMQVALNDVQLAVSALNEVLAVAQSRSPKSVRYIREEEAKSILEPLGLDGRKSKSILMSLCHWRRLVMHREEHGIVFTIFRVVCSFQICAKYYWFAGWISLLPTIGTDSDPPHPRLWSANLVAWYCGCARLLLMTDAPCSSAREQSIPSSATKPATNAGAGLVQQLLFPGFTDAGSDDTFQAPSPSSLPSDGNLEPTNPSEVTVVSEEAPTEIHENLTRNQSRAGESSRLVSTNAVRLPRSIDTPTTTTMDTMVSHFPPFFATTKPSRPTTTLACTSPSDPVSPPRVPRVGVPATLTSSIVVGTGLSNPVETADHSLADDDDDDDHSIDSDDSDDLQRKETNDTENVFGDDTATIDATVTRPLNIPLDEAMQQRALHGLDYPIDNHDHWEEEANPSQTDFGKQLMFQRNMETSSDVLSTASEMGTVIGIERMHDIEAMEAPSMERPETKTPKVVAAQSPRIYSSSPDDELYLEKIWDADALNLPMLDPAQRTFPQKPAGCARGEVYNFDNSQVRKLDKASTILSSAIRRIGSGLTGASGHGPKHSASAPSTPRTLAVRRGYPFSSPHTACEISPSKTPSSFLLRSPGSLAHLAAHSHSRRKSRQDPSPRAASGFFWERPRPTNRGGESQLPERRVRIMSDYSPPVNADTSLELQTPQRIKLEREDALDILTCLVERGVAFNEPFQPSPTKINNGNARDFLIERKPVQRFESADIDQVIRHLKQLSERDRDADGEKGEIEHAHMDVLEELVRSHEYALEMNRASQSAASWLKSIGRSQPDTREEEGKHSSSNSDVDDKNFDRVTSKENHSAGEGAAECMDFVTTKAMLNSARMKLKEKAIYADRLNEELAKCRAEIGRLKSASHSISFRSPNRSILDQSEDVSVEEEEAEEAIERSTESGFPLDKTDDYLNFDTSFLQHTADSPLLLEEQSELNKYKTALEKANEQIRILYEDLQSGSEVRGMAKTKAPIVVVESPPSSPRKVESPSNKEERMVNVRMLDAENFVTEWDGITPPLPPPPDHDHQVRDGFVMHVLPLLLRRADIRVDVKTRTHRRTTYDLAIAVESLSPSGFDATHLDLNRHLETRSARSDVGSASVACSAATTAITTNIPTAGVRPQLLASSLGLNTNITPRNSEPRDNISSRLSYDEMSESISTRAQPGLMSTLGGALGGLLTRRKSTPGSTLYSTQPFPRGPGDSIAEGAVVTTIPEEGSNNLQHAEDDNDDEEGQPYHRLVSAPAGRIGVTFVDFRGHAMVSDVATDSPLGGWIFPSDILIAIDELPVSGMRIRDIIKILKDRHSRQRALRVISSHTMNDAMLASNLLNDSASDIH